ncbi:class I SAM-dependent methyltransferase [Sporosarcina jeotgali]|uniref:Class I SAM-dependent methyltransferase n=1 Tax=Sporosarcina jeotgali TaxID=3020056 RepID=A0ABZ0KZ76_9BACL|nr:class I SAM-dependent methyltransferase [Sporosarcina sp. B2O-1]WOV85686.1 class I SAM-dependent methyltransferase [Sporosarcina sp. B2O-1]
MQKNYLDCLAVFGVGGAHPGGLQLTKTMLADEEFDGNIVVLDAGCGTGQTAEYLAKNNDCKILAVDNNPLMIEKAVKRLARLNKNIWTEIADIESLAYENDLIDVVLSESVIAFTTPAISIPELSRVLKKGGRLFAIEMVLEQPVSDEEKEIIMEFYGMEQLWTESEWENAFLQAGLRVQSIERPRLENTVNHESASDFLLSDSIDEAYYDMLDKHLIVTENYKSQLGFRIFKCTK